jgi:predicted phosphodiesterase
MRVLVLSDLHLEFGTFQPPDPSTYDVVVLAGDIHHGASAVHWARRPSTFGAKPVILVPGNHEFYGSERTSTLDLMRLHAQDTNVHVLDRDELIVRGVRFLGATLWTDFKLDAGRGISVAEAMFESTRGMNDFTGSIRERSEDPSCNRLFIPSDAMREHELSRYWLLERLKAAAGCTDGRPTVVVTHHAPSARSMDQLYEGNALNPCFMSELPVEFFQHAALWIHGHTHSSSDYLHHRTRVLANPRGYLLRSGARENDAYRSDLVIEIDGGAATRIPGRS